MLLEEAFIWVNLEIKKKRKTIARLHVSIFVSKNMMITVYPYGL